jgi:alkyl hydroperoxide reductase subunit AhpF
MRGAGLVTVPGRECPTCPTLTELVAEVAALSPHIAVESHDFYSEPAEAQRLGVDRIPCLVVSGQNYQGKNVKFYGLPSGYEFATLLEAMAEVSGAENPLHPLTRTVLGQLDKDVHIQVFVTPT